MLLKVINNSLESDDPTPVFQVDKQIKCSTIFDYYGVIAKDTASGATRLHIYPTIDEAVTKYREYDERLNSTLDPIEIDLIKNLCRELVILRPIYNEGDILCDNFKIIDVLETNMNYSREFPRY